MRFCDIRNNQGRPWLDYSGYYKNWIQLLFYYRLFHENIQKLLGEMQVDFICADKHTKISLETIQVLALFPTVCSAHCARYNQHI